MRIAHMVFWLLLAAMAGCSNANAATLPVADFVRLRQLTHPAISPNGQSLAVVVNAKAKSVKTSYEIGIFKLPGMQPVRRLETRGHYVSAHIEWVSDTRLIVELRRGIGSLASTSWVSNSIAVDYNGSHQKTMYFRGPRGFVSVGDYHPQDGIFRGIRAGHRLRGVPVLAGTPHPADGHFFLAVERAPHGSLRDIWQHGTPQLYDVDASTGNPRVPYKNAPELRSALRPAADRTSGSPTRPGAWIHQRKGQPEVVPHDRGIPRQIHRSRDREACIRKITGAIPARRI